MRINSHLPQPVKPLSVKFIHAADIHLDSPLSGLASYKDAPSEVLRTATRDAFTQLVDVAIEEAVDFMVIAGDLYDGNWKDYNTGHYFCREMGRLNRAGIPVYLLFGNHDAESEMSKKLALPSNVHLFDARKASTFHLKSLRVALHGRSFKEAATTENLAVGYPPPEPGWLNIGVLHTALEGNAAHATYAPCSLAELNAKGYDYWALGHVHEYAVLQRDPWVVFPGNLQGRHIRETGPRGAVMVSADETGVHAVERLLVDVLRWQVVDLDASAAQTLEDVVRLAGRAFEALVDATPGHLYLSVRVHITGKSAAHGELFGLAAHLRAEILGQAAAVGLDRLWVEKVRIETETLGEAGDHIARSDAIADLQTLLAEAPLDAALLAALVDDLRQLVDKAPLELIQAIPEFRDIRNGDVAGIVRAVSPDLLAYLAKAG